MKLVPHEPEHMIELMSTVPDYFDSLLLALETDSFALQVNLAEGYSVLCSLQLDSGKIIAIVVLQISDDGNKSLYVSATAGEIGGYVPEFRDCLDEVRKIWDCNDIVLRGRPGFTKMLGKVGFKVESVFMKWTPPEPS